MNPPRESRYKILLKEIMSVVSGEPDLIARMASVTSLLHHSFDEFLWTGFYLVDQTNPKELVIGPYQGTLGCLRIPIGKGVCGAAAESGTVQIVKDIHTFPGHIACDARSNSEIVIPVRNPNGDLIAVLDIDSERFGDFDEVDARGLQSIVDAVFSG
ncbi:MAG: GAF domain-containing protein [Proteobacteria bacterium]|nr:GAF domain-containing protein [Pseudomonadota bacterium]